MTYRALACYSMIAGGIAVLAGFTATAILPFHGVSFDASWLIDALACAPVGGLTVWAIAKYLDNGGSHARLDPASDHRRDRGQPGRHLVEQLAQGRGDGRMGGHRVELRISFTADDGPDGGRAAAEGLLRRLESLVDHGEFDRYTSDFEIAKGTVDGNPWWERWPDPRTVDDD